MTRGSARGTRTMAMSFSAPEGVASMQAHDEMKRLVGHLRKGVGRIEAHRHQQGPDLAREEGGHPAPLRGVALAMRQDLQAGVLHLRRQVIVVQGVLLVDQRVGGQRDVAHRGGGRNLRVARVGQPQFVERVGHPDLEELVEIGRHDAQVAQALEQRHTWRSRSLSTWRVKASISTLRSRAGQLRTRSATARPASSPSNVIAWTKAVSLASDTSDASASMNSDASTRSLRFMASPPAGETR